MTSQFSQRISEVLAYSREEAARMNQPKVYPVHLIIGILRRRDKAMDELFEHFLINGDDMLKEIKNNISASDFNATSNTFSVKNEADIMLTDDAGKYLKLAVLEARVMSSETVDDIHLLLAFIHDTGNNPAKDYFKSHGVEYKDLHDYVSKGHGSTTKGGLDLPDDDDDDFMLAGSGKNSSSQAGNTATRIQNPQDKTPILDNFGTDLTKAAEEGKLDPVVGREDEIKRVIEILCRRKKNNPILIGEPGVGKSAIVEGLAILIAKRETSPILFDKKVVTLDMSSIVAGTKYRGQFEERMKALIKELENNPNIIVFVDEIHTMVGAGSAPGSMDAANMLKPALARGTIQCIGATTLSEYRNSIEKDGALERRFQKVMVEPTTEEQTLQILLNIKDRYEEHHKVRYTDEALKACVKYTSRYVPDRQFPDKAIDALDEVGSKVKLKNACVPPIIAEYEEKLKDVTKKKQQAVKNQNYELAASYRDKQSYYETLIEQFKEKYKNGYISESATVNESDVADVVSVMAGIPVQRMTESEGERLRTMAGKLQNDVIAQDNAIMKMVKAIQRNRVGLRDPKHPIGAFMFLGPTGVGKTYLAKKLAEYMFGSPDALIRIDMSEYSESFNTSRLIGAPPGYVGYEEGGQLTERVRRHPYSIVLLDEIEKAHGNVFNMLLQVLDEGRLTDGNGRLVDFRNTVIIMTSNAGTRQLKEFSRGVGFTASGLSDNMKESDKEYARSIIQKSLSKQFSPEFLNRLDEIITFDQLDINAIKKIIDIELRGLYKRVEDMGYKINLSDKAKEFVATKGYDVQFGARPLKRAIQTYIEDGICEMILSEELSDGDTISIGKGKDKLTFNILKRN